MCFNLNVKAQDDENFYMQLDEGDEFVWEVVELNEYYFKKTFGSEPNFEIGDKIRIVITELIEREIQWRITVERWDYKENWGERGDVIGYTVYRNPDLFVDNIFIPSPTDDYLQKAMEVLDDNIYDVSGNSITKRVKSEIGVDYRWKKQFDLKGFMIREAIYTYELDIVIAMIEGGHRIIPFGFYFIGFIIFALLALVIISFKKKKIFIR
jgi:hypothetical protein